MNEIFVWKIRKIDLGNSLKMFFEWNDENKNVKLSDVNERVSE
nr:hypothetical protein [Mycoplasmopsis bovis]